MNRITDIRQSKWGGEGWSRHYKTPKQMREVEQAWVRYGFKVVAFIAGPERVRHYHITHCYVCGGKFLASRIDAEFCSAFCRKQYQRYQ